LNLGRVFGDLGGNLDAILVGNFCPDDVRIAITFLAKIDLTPTVVADAHRVLLSRQLGNFPLPMQPHKLLFVIVHCLSFWGSHEDGPAIDG
jgi:hypothetical protein